MGLQPFHEVQQEQPQSLLVLAAASVLQHLREEGPVDQPILQRGPVCRVRLHTLQNGSEAGGPRGIVC